MSGQPIYIIAPQYNFERAATPLQIRSFKYYIENLTFPEVQTTYDRFDEKIAAIRENLTKHFMQKLNVDVSQRIIPRTRIHIMDEDSFNKLRDELGYSNDTRAMYSNKYLHIYIKINDATGKARKESSMLRTLCHELVHSISYNLVHFTDNNTYIVIKSGFKEKDDEYFLFNEVVTDLCVLQEIKNYWISDTRLAPFAKDAFFEVPYYRAVIILDAIMEYVCNKSSISYQGILELLQNDYILGTKDSLKLIKSHLGIAKFEFLKNLGDSKTNKLDIYETGKALGLDAFLEEWLKSENGKRYQFCKHL